MKARLAISLLLLFMFSGVNVFGMACQTSCELGSGAGKHHHHNSHSDLANPAAVSSMDAGMDAGMDMSAMPPQRHVVKLADSGSSSSSGEDGACVGASPHSKCTVGYCSANRPSTLYQLHSIPSILPLKAKTAQTLVNTLLAGKREGSVQWPIHRIPAILRI